MKAFLRTHGQPLLVVLAAAGVMIYLWGEINWHVSPYSEWDGWHYRKIAEAAPGLSPEAREPFRFRVLGTWTVGLLFDDDVLGFRLVNAALGLILAAGLYLFLVYAGISPPVASFVAVLYSFNTYLFGVIVWYVFNTNDALALIFLLLGFWAMLERRWTVFAAALFLGALARETWILLPPTALVYLWERRLLRGQWTRLAVATLPAAAAAAGLRICLSADLPGNLDPFSAFLQFAPRALTLEFWARQFGNSLKPLTFLPLVFFGTTRDYFRANKYVAVFVLLTTASTLFASGNERLMAPAFIVFYWLFALIIERDIKPDRGLPAIIALSAFAAAAHDRQARFPLPSRDWTVAIGILAWLAVTASAIIFRLRGRRSAPPPAASA